MEQPETNENAAIESIETREVAPANSAAGAFSAAELKQASPAVVPAKSLASVRPTQVAALPCPTCGAAEAGGTVANSYIYALGQIEERYPRLSVEKEVAQAIGRAETAGRTDRQAFHQALSGRENRYLARQLCWVLSVQGLETYILQPRDPADFDLLIRALSPEPSPWISTVIGVRGPVAPPEYCNGLMIPIVTFDQIYTFSRDAIIEAIPRPEQIAAEEFGAASRELFDRIMQMTDNGGATDEHRALNYLSVRYPAIYAKTAEEFAQTFALSAVETRLSPLSGTRNIIEVIFAFTHRNTDFTEKFFVRIDVTEEFPFLVTRLSPYYDR
jgi:PatG Domain